MKAYRVITAVAAAGLLLTGRVMAGGAYAIDWDDDASQNGNNTGYIYTSAAVTTTNTLLPNGDLIQLVAIQGGSNYVLAASAIGSNALAVSEAGDPTVGGDFELVTDVASNILQGAIGAPLGILVYANAGGTGNHILITSSVQTVPSPNWPTPPSSAVVMEPDATDPTYTVSGNGGITTSLNGGVDGNPGYWILPNVIPEPSSITLVGFGLLGAVGMMRRRRRS